MWEMVGVQRRRRPTALAAERQRALLHLARLENDGPGGQHTAGLPGRHSATFVPDGHGGHRNSHRPDELGPRAGWHPLPHHQRGTQRRVVRYRGSKLAGGGDEMNRALLIGLVTSKELAPSITEAGVTAEVSRYSTAPHSLSSATVLFGLSPPNSSAYPK